MNRQQKDEIDEIFLEGGCFLVVFTILAIIGIAIIKWIFT